MIAASTGGVYYAASDPSALQKIYHMISDVINNSYIITYPTSAEPGDMIEVSATLEVQQDGKYYQGWLSSGVAEAF